MKKGTKDLHAEGYKLFLVGEYCFKNCKAPKIQYSYKKSANQNNAKKEEERLLKCYFRRFGEVPPLNSNLPNKYFDWENLKCD
jgi:hypothetical protein